ncbi:DUF2075 domain-containing protein [Longispora sp. K20-0274]|uniref:DNA/RNA helicase domain-containing protein n=1 Tax=Longispora sp. K20-0274 TaxID=3088255 RepID=UPI00399B849C
MSTFRRSVNGVLACARDGSLVERIQDLVGRRPAEVGSWEKSLPVLAQDLLDIGLGDVEMMIEYQLPLTSKRADVILAGVHPDTGADTYVIVELKQWSRANHYLDHENLVTVPGTRGGPRLHPGVQVGEYCRYLGHFATMFRGDTSNICGVAYLHNASGDDVRDLFTLPQTEHSRVFTGGQRSDLLAYLAKHLAPTSGATAADRLHNSPAAPSQQLMAVAADEIKAREQFILLDEQRIAYELVMHAVRRSKAANTKTVVVVDGGPGSGKSAIALSVLGELWRSGQQTVHATGSKSFTETLRKRAGLKSSESKELFKYFNSFMTAQANDLQVLICDEAHRIRKTSESRFTPAVQRTGRLQIDELLDAARVPVFLLDEHQVVRAGESGSLQVIADYVEARGLNIEIVSLHDQFRCGGSTAYDSWVRGLLGLSDESDLWTGDDRFEIVVAESPAEMEALLETKQSEGYSARMAAGFCWRWSKPLPDGTLVPDVRIEDWSRPWNLNSERSLGGIPGRSFWATAPGGFGQIGCVYTAQGFEYDWSGVIIGPDLVARNGTLTTVRAANVDKDLGGKRSLTDAEADQLIRNTYKVLLTRGMVGTVIYATDPATRAHLKERVRAGSTAS